MAVRRGAAPASRRRPCQIVGPVAASAAAVPVMFTLCMSRGHPPLADAHPHNNSLARKPVKGGYLLRYRRGFFCKGWCEEWFVLYDDSTLAWYSDKGLSRPRGHVRLSDAPELLAMGEWTRKVPRRPRFPFSCHVGQLLAIGSRAFRDVHWLMAQSPAEINDWMTAISNTLPPPPHLPLDNKRLSLTPQQDNNKCHIANGSAVPVRNGGCTPSANPSKTSTSHTPTSKMYEHDYTVLSGMCIGWGHGWGWGQASCPAQTVCHEPVALASSVYCHSGDDYGVGGYDECDWSAFGDFSF